MKINFNIYRIPFKAAIAARIYIELLLTSTSTPGSIAEQALWWSVHYHPGSDFNHFVSTAADYENSKRNFFKVLFTIFHYVCVFLFHLRSSN